MRDRVRIVYVDPRLNQVELRDAFLVEHRDFAVENGLFARPGGDG